MGKGDGLWEWIDINKPVLHAADPFRETRTSLTPEESRYLYDITDPKKDGWLKREFSDPFLALQKLKYSNPREWPAILYGFSDLGKRALMVVARQYQADTPTLRTDYSPGERDYEQRLKNREQASSEHMAAVGTNDMGAMLTDTAHTLVRFFHAGITTPLTKGRFGYPDEQSSYLFPSLVSNEPGAVAAGRVAPGCAAEFVKTLRMVFVAPVAGRLLI